MSTKTSKIIIPGGTFSEEGHEYRNENGVRVPSATQVIALLGMIDYAMVASEVLERKSAIGTATHLAIQYLCEGCLDWNTIDPACVPYVTGFEIWSKEQGFKSESQEGRGIHTINGMAYGFSYDHIGEMMYRGRIRKTVLDIKTCVAVSATWKLQTAAYALAAPKLPNGERYLRVILQLKEDGKFTPHYFEDRTDEQAWGFALYTCIWMLNNGLKELA